MELHKLGLMNLNGHGTDGDALAHFIARTQCKLAQADFGSTLAATLTIAERFTILKEAGADLTCRNRNN